MFLNILLIIFVTNTFAYTIPNVTFEKLLPNGFRASIPDEPNLQLFAFHCAVNRFVEKPDSGDYYDIIIKSIHHKWTYENHSIKLEVNDIIYYWIHWQINGIAYQINNSSVQLSANLSFHQYEIPNISDGDLIENTSENQIKISESTTENNDLVLERTTENELAAVVNSTSTNGYIVPELGSITTDYEKPPTTTESLVNIIYNSTTENPIHIVENRTESRGPVEESLAGNEILIETNTPGITVKLLFERISPKGFRALIEAPGADPELASFYLYGSINEEIRRYGLGKIRGTFMLPNQYGQWIYENKEQTLYSNDMLYYWINLKYKNIKGFVSDPSNVMAFLIGSAPIRINSDQALSTTPATTTTTQWTILTEMPARSSTTSRPQTTNRPQIPSRPQTTSRPRITARPQTVRTDIFQRCASSITTVNGELSNCKNRLIFEEKFDIFDSNIWQKQVKLNGSDGEFVMYDDRPENLYIENGHLHIVPTLTLQSSYNTLTSNINFGNRCTEYSNGKLCTRNLTNPFTIVPPIISAQIHTKYSFSFRYGRIDVRAKLPKGDWLFPQIFLEPLHNSYGKHNFASGQIRIAFVRGNEDLTSKENEQIDGHILYGGVVIDCNENLRSIWLKQSSRNLEHFGNEFHTYSLIWTNDTIKMIIDNIEYGIEIKGNFAMSAHSSQLKNTNKWLNSGQMAPFDKEFYITVGVGAGGNADFPDGSQTCFQHQNIEKPWLNNDPQAELNFANDLNWKQTWSNQNAKLIIDYIRVYSV